MELKTLVAQSMAQMVPENERSLAAYLGQMFEDGDENCVTLVMEKPDLVDYWSKERQYIFLNSINHSDPDLSKQIELNAFCLIGMSKGVGNDTTTLEALISLTKPIDTKVLIYFGEALPDLSILPTINRPVVWVSENKVC